MRKRYRDKIRSCALCKPHKRRWALRWSAHDLGLLEAAEHEIAVVLSSTVQPNKRLQRTTATMEFEIGATRRHDPHGGRR